MSGVSKPVNLYVDGGYNSLLPVNSAPAVLTNVLGVVPSVIGLTKTVGTANGTTAAETDLLAGATANPALTVLSAHTGFSIPANLLQAGRTMRLKCVGIYTTNGATATITPGLRYNTSGGSTAIATGVASGTFNSGAGPYSFSMDVIMNMLDATHILTAGSLLLGGNNPATTVSGTPSLASAAVGVVIDPTLAANICPTWTGSSNNAGNTFQLLSGTLEILN